MSNRVACSRSADRIRLEAVAVEAQAQARWRELVNTDPVHYGGARDIMLPPNGARILRGED